MRISLSSESRYGVDRKKLCASVSDYLKKQGLKEAQVSLKICGQRFMKKINRQYGGQDKVVEVLVFPQIYEGGDFVYPPGLVILGDVLICYPQAREIARQEEKLVDEVLAELAEQGVDQLINASLDRGPKF